MAILCLPAPAKRSVELHETLILVSSRLRQREFRGEKQSRRAFCGADQRTSSRAAAASTLRWGYRMAAFAVSNLHSRSDI